MKDMERVEACGDAELLDQIIAAVIRYWNAVHPDDELIVLSLPQSDTAERERILLWALEHLR